MKEHLELIWKKIDGELDRNDKLLFDALISEDELFLNLYKQQIKLNDAMSNMPLRKAPDTLLDNVMASVRTQVSVSRKYDDFKAFKYIIAATVLLCLVFTVYAIIISGGLQLEKHYLNINELVSKLNFNLSLPNNLVSYSTYFIILFGAVTLIWIDNTTRLFAPGKYR